MKTMECDGCIDFDSLSTGRGDALSASLIFGGIAVLCMCRTLLRFGSTSLRLIEVGVGGKYNPVRKVDVEEALD